jgi:hypothetical protein
MSQTALQPGLQPETAHCAPAPSAAPARSRDAMKLVVLPWLAGAVGIAAVLSVSHQARAVWAELIVLAWLLPLAAYDIRHREVPHIACVAVPCLAAAVYAWASGSAALACLAVIVVAISERRVIRWRRTRRLLAGCGLAAALALVPATGEAAPGAIAILGFWTAYELGWWAGADALAAMTLALLWPGIGLLLAMAVPHATAAALLRRRRHLCGVLARTSALTPAPGLPALALSAALLCVGQVWRAF